MSGKIKYQTLDDVYEKFSYDSYGNVYLGTVKNLYTDRTWHIFATNRTAPQIFVEGYESIENMNEALQPKINRLVSYCNKSSKNELDMFCLRDPHGPGMSDYEFFVPIGNVLNELDLAVSMLELNLIDF